MSARAGGVLAIDHGTKRTGFAVADALRIVVHPLDICHAAGDSDELVEHVAELVAERDTAVLLVGLPLTRDGEETGRAKDVRKFMARLGARLPELEVVAHDEHLTTKEAEARLREAGHHGDARKARRDSWSAWVLLSDWIEAGEPRPPAPEV